MIILVLVIIGLCLGSFVNALVWRIHEQDHETSKKKSSKTYLNKLSIVNGRSICPNCKHVLKTNDLVPVISWLMLGGKCRYCNKPISMQYPVVELSTALLFVASYIWWPDRLAGVEVLVFILWLLLLVGLLALFIYDLRWLLLPNRIIYPLSLIAVAIAIINVLNSSHPFKALIDVILAVTVGGGIFYVLFQLSAGKWIGGGDVKLGWLLGLIAGTPARSLLFIFLASSIGCVISLILIGTKKVKRTATVPFGPFLIAGIVIVQLFGAGLLNWYQHRLINP